MASTYEYLKKNGNKVLVDAAIRDRNGKIIDTYYVTLSTAQNISGNKSFNGGINVRGTYRFGGSTNNCYEKRFLGTLAAGTQYASLDPMYKDGTWHRMWRIILPNTTGNQNFWGRIRITLFGTYSSFNASGVMSKTITCNYNGSSLYNNVGFYDSLGLNVEKDFRISEVIWNNTTSNWEILVWQKNLNGNNSPQIMMEMWHQNNTTYQNIISNVTLSAVELTQATTYSATKASPTGGTKTVTWVDEPKFESPLGYEIFTRGNLTKADITTLGIPGSDTTYESKAEASGGTAVSLVTTGEKYIWNHKGTYTKPNTGIPKSDLDSAVQNSLGKADTALQSFTEIDPTVPGWAKASTKPSYTASEIGLGKVGNFKAVSTEANQSLTSTERANAKANLDIRELPVYTGGAVNGQVVKLSNGVPIWGDVPTELPTGGTVGQFLQKASSGVIWADIPSGGGGITEISTQTVRIWSLDTGIYRLTYNGTKTIYYNGNTSTSSFSLTDIDPLLFVQKDSSTVKSWWVFDKYTDGTYSSALQLRYGATTSTSGNSNVFLLPTTAGSSGQYLKSNGAASAPTWATPSGGGSVYRHSITFQGYDGYTNGYIVIEAWSSSSATLDASDFTGCEFAGTYSDGSFYAPCYIYFSSGSTIEFVVREDYYGTMNVGSTNDWVVQV